MTGVAANVALRRGACPGLSVPMPSGDGLLARLRPIGTISLAAFADLCAAARQFGNGVVEVTSRGSIQIRGLTASSAARFADAVAALAISADDGIPVHSNVLTGLDAHEILDAGSVAGQLRRTLAATSLPARLSPKISVVIDGGGALGLDNLAADVRLSADSANGDTVFHIGVAGDAATATKLGIVTHTDGVEAAQRILDVIARHGRAARARDVLATDGAAPFKVALANIGVAAAHSASNTKTRAAEPIGMHLLRDGSFACGLGLAFGQADATTLESLAQATNMSGASGIRVAADRALLIIGLTERTAAIIAAEAERLGFIVRADDPRRYVIACAGAPICASGHIAARGIARAITEAAGKYLDSNFRVHISGCVKGCAHAGAANLTIVGRADGCAVIANGSVHDAPVLLATTDKLPSMIVELVRAAKGKAGHV
jgi:precorrin-3B synthase